VATRLAIVMNAKPSKNRLMTVTVVLCEDTGITSWQDRDVYATPSHLKRPKLTHHLSTSQLFHLPISILRTYTVIAHRYIDGRRSRPSTFPDSESECSLRNANTSKKDGIVSSKPGLADSRAFTRRARRTTRQLLRKIWGQPRSGGPSRSKAGRGDGSSGGGGSRSGDASAPT